MEAPQYKNLNNVQLISDIPPQLCWQGLLGGQDEATTSYNLYILIEKDKQPKINKDKGNCLQLIYSTPVSIQSFSK